MVSLNFIEPIIAKKLNSLGFELYEIKYIRAGKRSILRIFIDKKDGPVTIADCENASYALAVVLDVEEFSSTPYTLEVSSPGIDRILIKEKDFKRVIGEQIKLQLKSGKTLIGILEKIENQSLYLMDEKEMHLIVLDDIHSGKIEVSFKKREKKDH